MARDLDHTVDGEPTRDWYRRHLTSDFLLWSPNIQAEAFLNWDRLWATRTIPHGRPKHFPLGEQLPQDFCVSSRGRTYDVAEFFRAECLSGLLIIKNGEIRLEKYALGLTPDRCWQSSSMVKSLAAILIGIALNDGYLKSVDDPIVNWVPELRGSEYEPVTIRHILLMSSGIEWSENTNDWQTDVAENYIKVIGARRAEYVVNYMKTLRRADPPGEQFYYNTGDTLLLSYVLSRATGMSVSDYCSERFWKPMGCENDGFFMLESDGGHEVVGSCCGATLRDYARWGTFMLQDGVAANGERLVPEGWVHDCVTPQAKNFAADLTGTRGVTPDPESPWKGYGYLWWSREDGDFMALGSYGQWIYVSPANNSVVVMVGAVPRKVYMNADQLGVHEESDHLGSELRARFAREASAALG